MDFTLTATLFTPPVGVLKPVGALAVMTVLPGVNVALNSPKAVFEPAATVICGTGAPGYCYSNSTAVRPGMVQESVFQLHPVEVPVSIDQEEGADRLNFNRGAVPVETARR